MNRYLVVLGLMAFLAGCKTANIRAEASPVLNCPESEIKVEKKEQPGVYVATGCGRMASCWLPDEKGAEPRCEGGAAQNPAP